ncbi:hypothetical protein [Caulobacter sp. NIBR2454]|nr:hypothetical protein [Caulobacter sp. NIBR2454]
MNSLIAIAPMRRLTKKSMSIQQLRLQPRWWQLARTACLRA